MNTRKWRNPYDPLKKKQTGNAPRPVPASLAAPPRSPVLPFDIRTSVSKIRTNIKGITSTFRQMEETMDTLYNAIQMIDSLGRTSAKPASGEKTRNGRSAPDREMDTESTSAQANPLANLDLQQVIQLLQSPLVQSLLSQHMGKSEPRKKEG